MSARYRRRTSLVPGWFLFLATVTLAGESSAPPASLCRADEAIVFSCPLAKTSNLVSMCGSKNLDNRRGYLQYRFGKPRAIELQFPRERANTQLAFRYAHYFRARVDRTEVTFDNAGYRYVIFDYSEGDLTPPIREAGVRVNPAAPSGKERELKCAAIPVSRLATLENTIGRDADNPLNR